ncbi:hypothetical protein DOY81_007818, partial [Sarcophaga bullata]
MINSLENFQMKISICKAKTCVDFGKQNGLPYFSVVFIKSSGSNSRLC